MLASRFGLPLMEKYTAKRCKVGHIELWERKITSPAETLSTDDQTLVKEKKSEPGSLLSEL